MSFTGHFVATKLNIETVSVQIKAFVPGITIVITTPHCNSSEPTLTTNFVQTALEQNKQLKTHIITAITADGLRSDLERNAAGKAV